MIKGMNQKEKIIYLAGIIDGEGCVKISKFQIKYKNKDGKTKYYFDRQARCEVSNTSKDLIDWLYDNFGGHKFPVRRKVNRKLQYRWKLRQKEIEKILPLIIPYLIVKKQEAKESLRLRLLRNKALVS